MRSAILVLALVLMAETTQARADQIVSYNMTGTVDPGPWNPVGVSNSSFNGNGGDHISWTMQYDLTTPGNPVLGGSQKDYLVKGPVITNLVDQTTGYHFPTNAIATSSIGVGLSGITAQQHYFGAFGENDVLVSLTVNGSLPTLNLANLQLNNLPINWSDSYFEYEFGQLSDTHAIEVGIAFTASVDSISGPYYGAPEPGSLTLFLLGAAGLAVPGIRRRLRVVYK